MFDNASILVTGGTGSFGNAFVPMTLARYNPKRALAETATSMAKRFQGESRLRLFIGDVRDRDRLYRAFDGVDFVVHAAHGRGGVGGAGRRHAAGSGLRPS